MGGLLLLAGHALGDGAGIGLRRDAAGVVAGAVAGGLGEARAVVGVLCLSHGDGFAGMDRLENGWGYMDSYVYAEEGTTKIEDRGSCGARPGY